MSHAWVSPVPYFARHELACKGTGEIRLDLRFAAALPALRQAWGRPLTPTSVCRAPEHNGQVSGHPRSLHLTINPVHPTYGTMAADLAWRTWSREEQIAFARLAWSMGWSVGLHDGFVHVDLRRQIALTQSVFVYGQWSGGFGQLDIAID